MRKLTARNALPTAFAVRMRFRHQAGMSQQAGSRVWSLSGPRYCLPVFSAKRSQAAQASVFATAIRISRSADLTFLLSDFGMVQWTVEVLQPRHCRSRVFGLNFLRGGWKLRDSPATVGLGATVLRALQKNFRDHRNVHSAKPIGPNGGIGAG